MGGRCKKQLIEMLVINNEQEPCLSLCCSVWGTKISTIYGFLFYSNLLKTPQYIFERFKSKEGGYVGLLSENGVLLFMVQYNMMSMRGRYKKQLIEILVIDNEQEPHSSDRVSRV